jgi:hypothetical protein
MVVVMLAAGIFAGMVLHSVFVLRQVELQILTGEYTAAKETAGENFHRVHME